MWESRESFCYSEARSVGRIRMQTRDELYFTMGGDKMVSHGENILDCAETSGRMNVLT